MSRPKVIYQHTMMQRKIRRYARMGARWRAPELVIHPASLSVEERRIIFGLFSAMANGRSARILLPVH